MISFIITLRCHIYQDTNCSILNVKCFHNYHVFIPKFVSDYHLFNPLQKWWLCRIAHDVDHNPWKRDVSLVRLESLKEFVLKYNIVGMKTYNSSYPKTYDIQPKDIERLKSLLAHWKKTCRYDSGRILTFTLHVLNQLAMCH